MAALNSVIPNPDLFACFSVYDIKLFAGKINRHFVAGLVIGPGGSSGGDANHTSESSMPGRTAVSTGENADK